jgi:2-acylglycerol O-acyltransferase 2
MTWDWLPALFQCGRCVSCERCLPWDLQVRITTVVGKPIEVPTLEEPSKAEVQQYLQRFIKEMKALFERHKAAAGYPDLELHVL